MEPTKSKVWRNWQILLPPELCERLALKPGDYLKFADQEDKVVVEKIRAWVRAGEKASTIENKPLSKTPIPKAEHKLPGKEPIPRESMSTEIVSLSFIVSWPSPSKSQLWSPPKNPACLAVRRCKRRDHKAPCNRRAAFRTLLNDLWKKWSVKAAPNNTEKRATIRKDTEKGHRAVDQGRIFSKTLNRWPPNTPPKTPP